MSEQTLRKVFYLLIACGIAFKFYGINDHWKSRDHYNYGGVYMMAATKCMKSTPLFISKGVVHTECDEFSPEPRYYRNHPPTIIFGLWGMTSIFGDHEWVYRVFTAIFSIANIFLILLLAREIWPKGLEPLYAAAFQALFLGNIYFGTHIDFIGEHTIFWILLAAVMAMRGRMWLAPIFAFAAGLTSWPGYMMFGPLLIHALLIKKGAWRVFIIGAVGFCTSLATMMWLNQTADIVTFFIERVNPTYLEKQKTPMDIWLPLRFLKNFIVSHSRILGPLLAVFAFYELILNVLIPAFKGGIARMRNDRLLQGVLLAGGTGLVHFVIGIQFIMIHVYLYLFFTPALAICCASFLGRYLHSNTENLNRRWIFGLTVIFLVFYPYGIFQSSLYHDVLNSSLYVFSALYFAIRKGHSSKSIIALVALLGLANFSQTANYRNEPDRDFQLCEKARLHYQTTGQPFRSETPSTMAQRLLYCRGIPIIYPDQN